MGVKTARAGHAPHWPAGAIIRVWIEPGGTPPGAAALVERAMKTWTGASGGRLTLARAPSPHDAVVRVLFAGSHVNYGETAPRVDWSRQTIVSADIAINADVPEDTLAAGIVIYLTALHELGHALGLGHTDDFGDIMYRFRRPDDGARYFGVYRQRLGSADDIGSVNATGLSRHDIESLRQLYGR